MRLFVAVEIEPALVRAASALIDELRARVARLAPRAKVTWLTAERLHLTLAFIGTVEEGRLTAVRHSLQIHGAGHPFPIRVRGVGAFPEHGRPRVLWAGIDDHREELVALADRVSMKLRAAGLPVDDRPQQPHLTLGRIRDARGLHLPAVLAGLDHTVLGTTMVGAITLFESRLSPAGPAYVVIERMSLSEAPR